jgi:hypothetical protein
VTVTLPVHALTSRSLAVVRHVRSDDGTRRYIDAEHPHGGTIRLPIEWTDRAPLPAPPRIGDREVRLDARGLVELAAAVEAALGEKVGPADPSGSMPRDSDACSEGRPAPGVVLAVADGAARPARRVGRARSQDASRRGGRRERTR